MNTIIKNRLDELAGGNPFSSGGDRNVTNDSEIETGPVQKAFNDNSEYEKGNPVTTDKVASQYRQDIPWFATYTFGARRLNGAVYESEKNSNIIKKKVVEEKIDDLVKKSKSSDLTDKDFNPKIEKIIDNINDTNFSEEQLEKIKKALDSKQSFIHKPKTL